MIKYIAFFFVFSVNASDRYDRSLFHYKSYSTNSKIGFYTKKYCKTNIDHVVSLKDAYDSGANKWNNNLKKKFANDKENHVPSCYRINSSKGSSTPKVFLRKSSDNKGLDYKIVSFCKYLNIYHKIKKKYYLSFSNNSTKLFMKCNISIKSND